jgi:hypothetical protein
MNASELKSSYCIHLAGIKELIAAAHAGCFSMAFSKSLEDAGYKPKAIDSQADVSLERTGNPAICRQPSTDKAYTQR